jgi:hypothetical protein
VPEDSATGLGLKDPAPYIEGYWARGEVKQARQIHFFKRQISPE